LFDETLLKLIDSLKYKMELNCKHSRNPVLQNLLTTLSCM